MLVRAAREEEITPACALLEAAFDRSDEARLLRSLREGDDLALTLVAVGSPPVELDPGVTAGGGAARVPPGGRGIQPSETEEDGPVLGVAVLSHLVSPKGSVGLGPLAVAPEHSDRGIGKALIGESIARARREDYDAIFVLGQPPYYTRFGFSVDAARGFHSDYPPEFLLALELKPGALEGGGALVYPAPFAGL